MQELKKYQGLLSVLVVLLVAKFVVVPVFDWQESLYQENQANQKKLLKVKRLIEEQDQLLARDTLVSGALDGAEKLIFKVESEAEFKLTQQQFLEELLAKHNLRAENFGWQSGILLDEVNIKQLQLQLRFSGSIVDLVNFVAALEQLEQRYHVVNFNVNFSKGSTFFRGGRLALSVYINNDDQINNSEQKNISASVAFLKQALLSTGYSEYKEQES